MKVEWESLKKESEKFRYRKVENLGQIELPKGGGFRPKSNLCYLISVLSIVPRELYQRL